MGPIEYAALEARILELEATGKRAAAAEARVAVLEEAIRKHRRAKGHERRDLELWDILGEHD